MVLRTIQNYKEGQLASSEEEDEDNLNDRGASGNEVYQVSLTKKQISMAYNQSAIHLGQREESPNPKYENEYFEGEDEAADLGSDEYSADSCVHDDPLREDVSSEGSCRTSIYQRSQKGEDNEDFQIRLVTQQPDPSIRNPKLQS